MITEEDLIGCSSLELADKLWAGANPGQVIVNAYENGPCDLLVRDHNGSRDECMSWRTGFTHLQGREHISDIEGDYYEDYSKFQYGYYNQSSLDKELWNTLGKGIHSEIVKNAAELYSILSDAGRKEDADNWEEYFKGRWGLADDFSLDTFRIFCLGDPYKRYTASQRQENHFVLGHHNMQALIIPHLGPYNNAYAGTTRLVNWNRVANILRFIGILVVEYTDGAADLAKKRDIELFYRLARNTFSEIDKDSFRFPKVVYDPIDKGGPNAETIYRYSLITADFYDRIGIVCQEHAETVQLYRASFPDLNEWTHREVLRVVAERRFNLKKLTYNISGDHDYGPGEIQDWKRERVPLREMSVGLTKASRVSYLLDRAMINYYAVRLKKEVPSFVLDVLKDKDYEINMEVKPNTMKAILSNLKYFASVSLAKLFKSFLVFFFHDKSLRKFTEYVADLSDDMKGFEKSCHGYDMLWNFYFTSSGCRRWAAYHVRKNIGKAMEILSNVSHRFAFQHLKGLDLIDIAKIIYECCKARKNYWLKRYEGFAHPSDPPKTLAEKAKMILCQNRCIILPHVKFKLYAENVLEAEIDHTDYENALYKIADRYAEKRSMQILPRKLGVPSIVRTFDLEFKPMVRLSTVIEDCKRIMKEVTADVVSEVEFFMLNDDGADLTDVIETADKAAFPPEVENLKEEIAPAPPPVRASASLFDDLSDEEDFSIKKKNKKKIDPTRIDLIAHHGSNFKTYDDAIAYSKTVLGPDANPTRWSGPLPEGAYSTPSIVNWYKTQTAKLVGESDDAGDKEEIVDFD